MKKAVVSLAEVQGGGCRIYIHIYFFFGGGGASQGGKTVIIHDGSRMPHSDLSTIGFSP